ncbi:Chaperone protein DnaJ [Porphyridium purpureum]|uniref:Chaperone protein DnaJ n=1 Tax=Porphyridium purpureum TaxID=35688 RepID=A0A5J4Z4W2_PORPP|nr:Chaperone protein DnaJ [Porphyridium purpureum]|eukprot:POR5402..scf295_1
MTLDVQTFVHARDCFGQLDHGEGRAIYCTPKYSMSCPSVSKFKRRSLYPWELYLGVQCGSEDGRLWRLGGARQSRVVARSVESCEGAGTAKMPSVGSATHYARLGLSLHATQQEAQAAFRELAKRWHPDRHGSAHSKAHAERVFKGINESYERVCDDIQRGVQRGQRFNGAYEYSGQWQEQGHQYAQRAITRIELFEIMFPPFVFVGAMVAWGMYIGVKEDEAGVLRAGSNSRFIPSEADESPERARVMLRPKPG